MQTAVQVGQSVIAGRYQLESLLGSGGMGAVYAVRDLSTGRRLALKRLHERRVRVELFEREYRTLAGLRHPGIVEVYEYGIDDESAFYTMELLEGGDLSKRAPMPWREVCTCMSELASILGVLHARRLVHRDLTPRNLWQLSDGRLKLLDFGALSPFGEAREVLGTPAFVPPEALEGKALDQRTDLYALGALGYWLLTSAHAYRATDLNALRNAWARTPVPPSSFVKHVEGADQNIPSELETLILSLLRLDPKERPQAAADVMEQLNALTGAQEDFDASAIQGYLDSSAFVGRKKERQIFGSALSVAAGGKPQSLLIEGAEGAGRTRLLTEFAMMSRLSGALVISARAGMTGRPYEGAIELGRALLMALPQATRAAAEPHAQALSPLFPELALPADQQPVAAVVTSPAEERSKLQGALASWLLTVAKANNLVLLVDDLHGVDEESQALLATLARADRGVRLVVVSTLNGDSPLADSPLVRAFAAASRRSLLPALTRDEIGEMLRSVFGDVVYLDRLSARLHAVSHGSPSHCLLLVRHLVSTGEVRYVEGSFLLPAQVPDALPSTLQDSVLSSLESLPDAVRKIAQLASVPDHGRVTRAMIAGLSDAEPASADLALNILIRERLVREVNDGLVIAHPVLREKLWRELPEQQRAQAHRKMAQLLTHEGDSLEVPRRALHLLRAGDFEEGESLLLQGARTAHPNELRAAVPMYEAAYALLRAAGRNEYSLTPALSVLAVAGYMVHHVYADRYGDDALRVFQRVLRFDLARRLRPYVGGLLALVVALIAASIAMKRSGLRLKEVTSWLVPAVVALAGAAHTCMDLERARRHADALTPLISLGKGHAATILRSYCLAATYGIAERQSEGQRLIKAVLDRLQSPEPIAGMQEHYRGALLAGASYAAGTMQALSCGEGTLQTADRIESLGPLAALQADQLRAQHYALRGDRARGLHYRKRVELQAIQLGTAWQVELYAPARNSRLALWLHDPAMAKRAMHELERLAAYVPSLSSFERTARATYLVLRKKEAEALPFLQDCDERPKQAGWSYQRALLARVYNSLGEHQKAKDVCLHTLSQISSEDLAFVAVHLNTLSELSLADAGLGAFQEAERRLGELLQTYADRGPLVLGWIHRAQARVALLKGELEAAEAYLARMEQQYRSTEIPTLLVLAVELRDELRRLQQPVVTLDGPLTADDAHLLTRIGLIMTTERDGARDRAMIALRLAREMTGAERGFIVDASARGPVASLDYEPSEAVCEWAQERLLEAMADEEQTASLSGEPTVTVDDVELFEGMHHRLCLLWSVDGHVERPIAALVLVDARGACALPPAAALRLMGERLGARTRGVPT